MFYANDNYIEFIERVKIKVNKRYLNSKTAIKKYVETFTFVKLCF